MLQHSSIPTSIIITKEQAIENGMSFYNMGKACKYGHFANRYVSNRQCVTCNAEKARFNESRRVLKDPSCRMFRNVQRRAGQALNGIYSPLRALACNQIKLGQHIESQFTEGMCWEKYGQWEVDHIIPLSAANDSANIIRLCNYQNLQPLWRRENRKKGGA